MLKLKPGSIFKIYLVKFLVVIKSAWQRRMKQKFIFTAIGILSSLPVAGISLRLLKDKTLNF